MKSHMQSRYSRFRRACCRAGPSGRARRPRRSAAHTQGGRPGRFHRLLGFGRDGRLALAHGHSDQRRLCEHSLQRRGAQARRRLESRQGRSRRESVQGLWRPRHHAGARALCISPGRTITRCASTPTPERRPGCSTSTANAQAGEPPGKDIPSPIGKSRCAGRARRNRDWEPLVRARKAGARSGRPRYCAQATCARTARPTAPTRLLKEYFDLSNERNGDTWFVVTTVVDDPQYLTEPFVTSTNWKKEPDGAKWAPSACSAR